MLASSCSGYYLINKLNKLSRKSGLSLFISHCNTRSLSKNFNTLKKILNFVHSRADILGITEIKLDEFSITKLDLNNYTLFRTDSKSKAGGTAFYIYNTLKAIPLYDIGFDMVLKNVPIFGIKATVKRESKWLRFVCLYSVANPVVFQGCKYNATLNPPLW